MKNEIFKLECKILKPAGVPRSSGRATACLQVKSVFIERILIDELGQLEEGRRGVKGLHWAWMHFCLIQLIFKAE